jgi:hypothetical protein
MFAAEFPIDYPVAILAAVALIAFLAVVFKRFRTNDSRTFFAKARARFAEDRAMLETHFFRSAAATGKPRGLRWTKCEWSNLIEWARDRVTGQLLALVGVTISFEAIEGGDMEGVEAVSNLRNATAVFYYDGAWHTAGRVVFNLNPDEVLAHFREGYERVDSTGELA